MQLSGAMDESTNHRDLLQLIEGTLYAGGEDVDCSAFLAALQHAKPAFLNLLRYKVRDAMPLRAQLFLSVIVLGLAWGLPAPSRHLKMACIMLTTLPECPDSVPSCAPAAATLPPPPAAAVPSPSPCRSRMPSRVRQCSRATHSLRQGASRWTQSPMSGRCCCWQTSSSWMRCWRCCACRGRCRRCAASLPAPSLFASRVRRAGRSRIKSVAASFV